MWRISQHTGARAAGRSGTLVGRALLALIAPAALVLLWRTGERLLALQAYPYPADGLEGTLLHEAGLLRAGEPLYQPLAPYRFVSAPYPPVHPLVLSLIDRLPGPHVFWSGRLISLISALAIAMLIVLMVRRAGNSWMAGALSAGLFLSAAPVILWATRIKPDMFALLWTSLGLCLALFASGQPAQEEGRHKPGGGRAAALAAICFALAFFTKQTAVVAPLAAGLALLIGDRRAFRAGARVGFIRSLPLRWRTLLFGLLYLALAAGAWAVLDLLTGGQYTYHVWEMHRGEGLLAHNVIKFARLLAPYWPLMILSGVLVLYSLRDTAALVPACYALLAPITLAGSGATGANHNHLLETLLALCVAGGSAPGRAAVLRPSQLPLSLALIGLFALQVGLAFRPPDWYRAELAPADPPKRFLALIRSMPGEVLADDIGLLYAAGKPIRYDDPAAMGPLAMSGHWDQRGLLDDVAQRRFSAILIPVDVEREASDHAYRWSPEMIRAIRDHYRIAYRDTIYTYLPRQDD